MSSCSSSGYNNSWIDSELLQWLQRPQLQSRSILTGYCNVCILRALKMFATFGFYVDLQQRDSFSGCYILNSAIGPIICVSFSSACCSVFLRSHLGGVLLKYLCLSLLALQYTLTWNEACGILTVYQMMFCMQQAFKYSLYPMINIYTHCTLIPIT